ncbi:MAG: PIN domain-containing protein [Candidatus Dormibacteria bacterium]
MTVASETVVDTNVLIYAHQQAEPRKRAIAQELMARLGRAGTAKLPAQVLAEFSQVALHRSEPRLDPAAVAIQVERLRAGFDVLPLTAAVVLEALRGVRDHVMSYFDAQIWAAARLAQATIVYSEDFGNGSTIEGVTFVDPFQ